MSSDAYCYASTESLMKELRESVSKEQVNSIFWFKNSIICAVNELNIAMTSLLKKNISLQILEKKSKNEYGNSL